MAKYGGRKTRLSTIVENKNPKGPAGRRINLSAAEGLAGYVSDFFRYVFGIGLRKLREARLVMAGIGAGILIAFIVILVMDFHRVQALATFQPNVTTKIYDKNNVLISELFKQKREIVPFEKVPANLVNAFIAIEDNEFYDHFGVNPRGIIRAFFVNIIAGGIKQGGSTITQQLSKILLTSRKRTIYRKIKEAFISIMMEFSYSKEEILQLYLNQIFLGHGAYGVESAAQIYFEKHIWDCSLAECALIASLPSAPNLLSPIRHPKTSMKRHRLVLARMVEMGFISVEQAESAYLNFWPDYLVYISEIAPTINTWSSRIDKAPWFTEYIRRKLIKKYGEDTVYNKGLTVYTTLDLNKQRAGQEALWDALDRQNSVSSQLIFTNEDYFMDNFSEEISLVSDLFDMDLFAKKGLQGK